MGGALEVGYLYVALTPPSKAWRAAAVSRILREFQSSCMIFIFTVLIFLTTFRSEFSCTQYVYGAYRECPRVGRPLNMILPADLSMRAECMHEK